MIISKSLLKKNIDIFILFLLMHSFYLVPPIVNSSLITPLICLTFIGLYKGNYLFDIYVAIKNKYIYGIYFFIFVLILINLLIITLHMTFDISYVKNYISHIIQLSIIIIVSVYIFNNLHGYKTYVEYAEKLIVYIFVIQSIVEVFAFLSPQIASIIHMTYAPGYAEIIYEQYGGVRGLALTGSAGWGLAVGYGFAFLFYVKSFIVSQKITLFNIIIGLLLVLGTFFAGRSGFLGAILGIVYYLFSTERILKKFKSIFIIFFSIIFIILLVYISFPSFVELLVDKVFPFVFEFYYHYKDSGKVQTWSTNRLMEMWSIPISEKTMIIGDGLFMDSSGDHYYMRTDVGFVRNTLFGGIFFTLLIVVYHSYLSSGIFLFKNISKDTKTFIIFVIVYALILEAKAMTLGFNKYAFSILIFYFIAQVYDYFTLKRRGVIN